MHFPRPPCPQLTIRTLTTLSVTIISPNSHLQRSWNWPSTVYGTRRWSTESFVRRLSLFLKRLRLLPRIHMNSTRFPERVTDSLTVTRDRYFWHLHDPCDLKCAPPHSCKWNIDVLSGSPNKDWLAQTTPLFTPVLHAVWRQPFRDLPISECDIFITWNSV